MAEYTEQQLIGALRKADAAGDTEAARAIARRIQAMRQPKEWQPKQRTVEDLRAEAQDHDATEGMTFGQRFAAGMGKSIVDTGRGIAQLTGFQDREDVDQQRALDADLMADGAGIAGNVAGVVGQFLVPGGVAARFASGAGRLGTVASMAPRAVPVANAVRAATLPTSLRGAVAQGAVVGGIQPVATGESRLANMAMGGGAGAAGVAIPRGLAALYRGTGSYLGKVTPVGAERRAARILLAEAESPAALTRAQPSSIPGVRRTLAEETLDPGIARLERNARSTGRGFDSQDRANNAARVQAMRSFAGDEAQVAAAQAARAKATNPLYAAADKVDGVDTSRLLSQIKRLENAQEGRPAVQGALGNIRSLLTRAVPEAERKRNALAALDAFATAGRKSGADFDAAKAAMTMVRRGEVPTGQFASQAGRDALKAAQKAMKQETVGHDKMRVLSNVRLTLGDMLAGRYGGDSGASLAGAKALMAVKGQLDRVVAKHSPEFGQATQAFRDHSRGINRMEVGQALMGQRSGSAILDPVTGEQVLTPAAFSNQARNLDRLTRDVTGFRKARAADVLRLEDMRTIRAIQDDLERRAFAATAGSGGNSQTFERMALNDRVAGGFASRIPVIGRVAEYLGQIGETRLQAKLGEMLADPSKARAILATLPADDRRVIENAMVRIGGTTGVLSPALAE